MKLLRDTVTEYSGMLRTTAENISERTFDTEQVDTKIEGTRESQASALYYIVLVLVIVLSAFGVLMVFSSSIVESLNSGHDPFFELAKNSVVWLAAILLMFVASKIPFMLYYKASTVFLIVACGMQAILFLVPALSVTIGGNTNWLNFGLFTFQPSELIKLTLILWLAKILSEKRYVMSDLKQAAMPAAIGIGAAAGLILAGKDVGTVAILLLIIGTIYFCAGIKPLYLGIVGVGGFAALLLFSVTSASRLARIIAVFGGCEYDPQGTTFQLCHSLFSLGSGGLTGVGLGASREKWNYLPQASNDFILAIIGEELGLIGSTMIILIFVVLSYCLYRIIRILNNQFARLVTAGVMAWILFQALINILVVIGWFPVMGLPLPFVSAGGTSLIVTTASIGVVLSFLKPDGGKSKKSSRKPRVSIEV